MNSTNDSYGNLDIAGNLSKSVIDSIIMIEFIERRDPPSVGWISE